MDPTIYIAGLFDAYVTKSTEKGLVAQMNTMLGRTPHQLLAKLEKRINFFMPVMARFDASFLEQMRARIVEIEKNAGHPVVLKIEVAIQKAKSVLKEDANPQKLAETEEADSVLENSQSLKEKVTIGRANRKRDSLRLESAVEGEANASIEDSQNPRRKKRGSQALKRSSLCVELPGGEEGEVPLEPPQRSPTQSPKRKSRTEKAERKSDAGDNAETTI